MVGLVECGAGVEEVRSRARSGWATAWPKDLAGQLQGTLLGGEAWGEDCGTCVAALAELSPPASLACNRLPCGQDVPTCFVCMQQASMRPGCPRLL
eukprot:214567-Chlamydomonas_euryale.AAC.1